MGIGALREHCAGFEMINYCLNKCSGSFVMIQYLLILFSHKNAGDNSSGGILQCRISLLVWILMDPNYDYCFYYYTSTVEVVMKEPPTLKRRYVMYRYVFTTHTLTLLFCVLECVLHTVKCVCVCVCVCVHAI